MRVRIALLSLSVWAAGSCDSGASVRDFPPPTDRFTAAPAFEDFVGAEPCAGCHAERYDQWAASTHGTAGGDPTPDMVIASFDGTPIQFRDAEVVPRVASDGTYEFVVRQDGHPELIYRVDGVIGRAHMVGGGTQGFTTRMEDGTERFLPFDWSGSVSDWFCNTGTRTDAGWVPVTPDMALADCGDWPPLRVLGTVDRFGNCQGCHGSQILTEQPQGEAYRTRYTTLRINCESCHGPGRTHVELAQSGRLGFDEGTGLQPLTTLDTDGSLDLCFQCHALKDVVREGHLPGPPLADYYALKFPVLGDDPFYPDFRIKTFAYQATHLASACYLDGEMTCNSCHEPHGQEYQDEFGGGVAGRFDDEQCTSCHASKALDIEAHTFHPAGSDGARCVSCHMPYLQEPEVGDQVEYARSDHTIPVPRPAFDAGLGIESACAMCHQDQSAEALDAQARAWWGDLKPHRPLVQALIEATSAGGEGVDLDLLQPDQHDPLAQFAGLGRVLLSGLEPDAATTATALQDRLLALAAYPDLDVRALALASLHWWRGGDPATKAFLVEALEDAGPQEDRLRRRWVLGLSFLGDDARTRGEADRALIAYEKALELLPDDPRILGAAGAALNQVGDFERAIPYLERSVAGAPNQALTRVNLASRRRPWGRSQRPWRATPPRPGRIPPSLWHSSTSGISTCARARSGRLRFPTSGRSSSIRAWPGPTTTSPAPTSSSSGIPRPCPGPGAPSSWSRPTKARSRWSGTWCGPWARVDGRDGPGHAARRGPGDMSRTTARLGLYANRHQFALLVLVNAFVGTMVGVERSVLPLLAEEAFGIVSARVTLSFLLAFGLTKALTNFLAGDLAGRLGRRRILVAGWLFGLPVPFLLMWAPSWDWVVLANALLGINQGLAWSATVIMKIDLVGPRRRGLAMGINESAGYLAVGLAALGAGYLAAVYGPRPAPYVLAAVAAVLGLLLSAFGVRDTGAHVELEQDLHGPPEHASPPYGSSMLGRLARGSWGSRSVLGANQAGLVNNLNDGLAWGLLPVYLAAQGLGADAVGLVAATYPVVWGAGQLVTGWASDRVGRRPLIVAGMLLQAVALFWFARGGALATWLGASMLLGVGTAAVYPTLIAQISDVVAPEQRASTIGVYRLWRDGGYVVGALIAGVVADQLGYRAAIVTVAGLTLVSGFLARALLPRPVRTGRPGSDSAG